ncbi:hypothetical protein AB0758_44000 [Tolypothrix bouteillei VB521301_2]|uniref:Uncharacterized protein n=1 Tax=Tolypothrix bouteillei VB521301 TaxID=1479485 RepID=A0A0C1NCR2_9CYAN
MHVQDILTASAIVVPVAFITLMIADFIVGLFHLAQPPVPPGKKLTLSQIMDRPEITPTDIQQQELLEMVQLFNLPQLTYSEWLATDIEDASLWNGTPHQERATTLPDPWTVPTEEVIANAPVTLTPLPTLRLLPPAQPAKQPKRQGKTKKVQTAVQTAIQTAVPKRRGRQRKTA